MNKEEMQEVFKKLGLNEKQIKQANMLHKLNKNQEQKKGGGAVTPTEAEFQKMFDFDDKTVANLKKVHAAAVKQNQLALRKTQKIRGGGAGFMFLSMLGKSTIQATFLANGGWIAVGAFHIGWGVISTALNKYIDGFPIDDPQFNYISKLMTYVIPVGMVQYFVTKALLDGYIIQAAAGAIQAAAGATMKGGEMSGGTFFDIPGLEGFPNFFSTITGFNFDTFFKESKGLTWLTGKVFTSILKPVFTTLISLSSSAGGALVSAAKGDVVLTVISLAFIGKYMYTRYYGSNDQNKDLDKTLYMNWKRRRMIIKAYENRKTREKRELEDRQERYKQKEEELLERLEQGEEPEELKEEPKEVKKTEEIVRKNPVWYGYKITDDDRDEFYQKSFKKTASRKKSAKSDDDDKEAGSQQDDAEFLKKAEEILEKK
jgi:hypothetical protein